MRLAVLSRKPQLYSTRRLVEAARVRGHQVSVINYMSLSTAVATHRPQLMYRGAPLPQLDAVIPRIGASTTFYGTTVLRHFETMGVFALNGSQSVARARNKLRALQILAHKGIQVPLTGFAHSAREVQDLIEVVGGVPVVIKLLKGTQGIGVVLAETRNAAESVIEALRGLNAYILVQEFIGEARGQDVRCFVVGDEVVASIIRRAPSGEFRANIHRGGTAEKAETTPEERAVAVRAAQALGLCVAGVDLLRSHRGPLVVEVNASPGLEAIEGASGVDVATPIIHYVERHTVSGVWQEKVAT